MLIYQRHLQSMAGHYTVFYKNSNSQSEAKPKLLLLAKTNFRLPECTVQDIGQETKKLKLPRKELYFE
jgi:hypothetical protein